MNPKPHQRAPRPVRVDKDRTPTRLAQANALAALMPAAVAEEWTDNHEAEWAALEGLDRIAKALDFEYHDNGDELTVRDLR